MDVSKLDKMKVVDLRNELQSRGLDTKGVKAVLVERLRAFLEGGEGENAAPATPTLSTPAKRSRRTRSMTRSPSPSPKKTVEPELEALPEEENETTEEPAEDEEMEEAPAVEQEKPEDVPEAEEDSTDNNQQEEDEHEQEEQAVESEQVAEESEEKQALENDHDKNTEQQDEEMNTEQEDKEMKEVSTAEKSEEADDKEKQDEDADGEKNRGRKRSHSASSNHSHHSKERRLSKSKEDIPEDEPTIEDKQFGLSWFDSDLYLRIDPVTFTSAKPMSHEIFALVWAGARANYGVRDGKVCFEVRLAEETNMNRSHQFRDEPHVRGFRVGFSLPNTKLMLGEEDNSFAYCESGRKALNAEFTEYGKPYQLDDVIGCYLDLESTPCTIKYTLNGEDLGVAFEFDKSILGEEDALFPHIVTKGYEFHVNFADNENLLVNVERPKRMRRKPKAPKKVLTDDNNEKWEVVDETKPDEPEKGENADEEMKEAKEEEEDAAEKPTEKETEKSEIEEKEAEEAKEEKKENNEEKPEQTEEAEKDASKTDAAPEGEANGANGEAKRDEKDEKDEKDDEKSEKDSKDNDQKSESDSPSRQRRRRTESNNRHDQHSEDEYEEIIPEPRDPVSLLPGYELIALIPEERYIPGPQRPESRKECEVVLLVGLPGSGKTHWTLNRLQEQPEKRYHVIGADALISKMTIDGEPRKQHHKGRWEKVYELCLNSLSSLEDIAMKRRRNFILDQSNAYASAQRRKMKGFGDFKRIAVVCVPNADELKRRNDEKTEKGTAQNIRETTLNNLRANFTLPSMEFGWFDEIIHTDLSGDESKEEVKKYIEKGKKALDALNRDRRGNRNNRRYDDRNMNDRYRGNAGWQDNRNDRRRYDDRSGGYRGNSGWRDNRSGGGYDNRRYDGGGGYRNNSGGGGGGGYRDNRNNRYGGGGGGGGGSNWVQNNRHRYDDRYGSSGGGGGGSGGNRHRDNYGGGGGGGGGGGNYRSGGSSSGSRNQRDFRPGHHDNRTEGSRGGYDSAAGAASGGRYDHYSSSGSSKQANNGSSKGGKWSAYPAEQSQEQQQQQWQQQWQQYQQQQQVAPQQQHWGYGAADMQAYANQWQNDPNQQQWMSWYQQQGNMQAGGEANHYWSQYSYPTSSNGGAASGGAEAKK